MDWPVIIEIGLEVPSGNAYRQGGNLHHPHAYKRHREDWRLNIVVKLGARKWGQLRRWVEKNKPKMRVQFTCYRKHKIDPSNLVAGLKPVLDCLVMPKSSHPSGLGLIVDDSEQWLVELPPKQWLVGRGMRGWTRIELSPVDKG